MKTSIFPIFCLALSIIGAQSQVASTTGSMDQSTAPLTPKPYTVVAADGNSSVWERTLLETNSSGKVIPQKHSYVALEAGMNHLVNGQWVPSKEQIDILPDGTAAATNGQHQAYFPGDIYQGAITLITPDG